MYGHGCSEKGWRVLVFICSVIIFAVSCVNEPKKNENSLVAMIKARDIDGIKARFGTEEINTKDEEGYSLLHIAVRQNDAVMVEYLLTMGADIEGTDPIGRTPLVAAAAENAFKAAHVLAKYNAYIFASDQDGVSAFNLFYDKKQTGCILTPLTVLQKDAAGKTPLHYAAEMLDQNLTDELLAVADGSVQAMVKEQDEEGRSALAIAYARPEEKASAVIAAALLRSGADPLAGGFSAFETATEQRNYTMRFAEGQTALHSAAAAGHTGFVQFLLEQGVPVDSRSTSNTTPLQEAVRNGQLGAAAVLLEAGAKPDAEAALGNTALHFAVTTPHRRELINLLLEKQANPSIKDDYGETPLHIAVRVGAEPDILTALIKAGAAVNERNKRGETPLRLAVGRDFKEQAALLVKGGADIHAEDTSGTTPFVEAVRHHRDVLNAVLTKKTSMRQDSKGRNALHLAVLLKADNMIIEYLIRQNTAVNEGDKAGHTPLHYAVANNVPSVGKVLLANGADIFITDKQGDSPLKIAFTKQAGREAWILTNDTVSAADGSGNTPLHYAASWGMASIIPYIISRGGNPNVRNSKGETPLFAAVKTNNTRMVKALFKAGGSTPLDGSARDLLGNTVLHTAIEWNAEEAAEAVLLQLGTGAADLLNAKNTAGKTVLHIAAQKGATPFMNLCLAYRADINTDDATGRTPLVEAIRYGKASAALLLLKKGASPMRQDIQGRTALHEAVGFASVSVITALRTAGADPLARDRYGVTPVSKAFRIGRNILDAVLGTGTSLTNSDGETPLHIAVQEPVDEETLRYLISKKYAIDKRDKTGSSALLLAAKKHLLPLCTVLLESGADPFTANNEGESAVVSAMTGNTDILPLILKFAVSKTDASGNGLLHYAARYASEEIVRTVLAESKTDINRKNLAGETPAAAAVRWQRPQIAAMLQPQE